MHEDIVLSVNGAERRLAVDPERPLLDVLREELGLTGTKFGCGEGQCGACTVLVDDRAVRSCRVPVGAVGDASVRTIEDLAADGRLHPVQQAFVDHAAMQCGYCTPGMVLSAVALLRQTPRPTAQQVVDGMDGNICRCGTYPRIVDAVLAAAQGAREDGR